MPARRAPIPPELHGRAFTAAEARAAGLSKAVLAGPSVTRICRDGYVIGPSPASLTARAEAVLRVLPEPSLIAGVTALRAYGVEVGDADPLRFCTSAPLRCRRPGVRLARVRRLPARRGSLVAPAEALIQAAAELDLVEVVTAGDWLLRLKLVDHAVLTRRLDASTGRGCRTACRAATLVRERVDSPRESWLRLVLVLCGLPMPEVNPGIGTEFRFVGYVDLVYRRFQVLIEYEGDQHRGDKAQWNSDIGRYEDLSAEGWIVIRITAAAARRPRSVVYRIHQALMAHGYTGPEPVFGAEWVTLFERSRH